MVYFYETGDNLPRLVLRYPVPRIYTNYSTFKAIWDVIQIYTQFNNFWGNSKIPILSVDKLSLYIEKMNFAHPKKIDANPTSKQACL